jgi:hypothetical protein
MVEPRFSPADELQRTGELLLKDWKLALPTAVASLLVVGAIFVVIFGVIGAALAGGALGGAHGGLALGVGSGLLAVAALVPLGIAVLALAQAVVVAGSGEVYAGRPFDFSRSAALVRARAGDVLGAVALTSVGFAVFGLLSFALIGVPLVLALAYFTMYVQPAILIGGEGVRAAFATSYRLAKYSVGESVVALVGIIAAAIVGNVVNGLVVHIPLLNLVAGFAIGGLTSAFAALVGARFYLLLRDVPFDETPELSPPAP